MKHTMDTSTIQLSIEGNDTEKKKNESFDCDSRGYVGTSPLKHISMSNGITHAESEEKLPIEKIYRNKNYDDFNFRLSLTAAKQKRYNRCCYSDTQIHRLISMKSQMQSIQRKTFPVVWTFHPLASPSVAGSFVCSSVCSIVRSINVSNAKN